MKKKNMCLTDNQIAKLRLFGVNEGHFWEVANYQELCQKLGLEYYSHGGNAKKAQLEMLKLYCNIKSNGENGYIITKVYDDVIELSRLLNKNRSKFKAMFMVALANLFEKNNYQPITVSWIELLQAIPVINENFNKLYSCSYNQFYELLIDYDFLPDMAVESMKFFKQWFGRYLRELDNCNLINLKRPFRLIKKIQLGTAWVIVKEEVSLNSQKEMDCLWAYEQAYKELGLQPTEDGWLNEIQYHQLNRLVLQFLEEKTGEKYINCVRVLSISCPSNSNQENFTELKEKYGRYQAELSEEAKRRIKRLKGLQYNSLYQHQVFDEVALSCPSEVNFYSLVKPKDK